jgi:hypothetical protein
MRFGTWDIRSLYRAGSLLTLSKELSKCKLDLKGMQEFRWEGGGSELTGQYTFFYEKGNENHELGTRFLCKRESSAVTRIEFLVIRCHT